MRDKSRTIPGEFPPDRLRARTLENTYVFTSIIVSRQDGLSGGYAGRDKLQVWRAAGIVRRGWDRCNRRYLCPCCVGTTDPKDDADRRRPKHPVQVSKSDTRCTAMTPSDQKFDLNTTDDNCRWVQLKSICPSTAGAGQLRTPDL